MLLSFLLVVYRVKPPQSSMDVPLSDKSEIQERPKTAHYKRRLMRMREEEGDSAVWGVPNVRPEAPTMIMTQWSNEEHDIPLTEYATLTQSL